MDLPPVQKAIPETDYPRVSSIKNVLVQVLKFGLAAAVVVYLVARGDIAWEPLRASLTQWQYTLPGFLILAITPLGQFWRWQALLRSGGLLLPNGEVFSYLMVSKFFNMAFPGYVSGDILRGFYVFRRASTEPTRGAEASGIASKPGAQTVVASIFFDRAAGLLPLFVMSLAGLVGAVWHPLPQRLIVSVAVVACAGVAGMIGLFLFAYWFERPPAILIRISRLVHAEQSLFYLHQVTHYYVRNLRLMRNILGISFVTQGTNLASFVLFGLALKVEIPVSVYLMLVPLGLMVTAIPVTPAGLGVGQVAFLSLFHMAGTSQGANLYTLYIACYVLINLSGALMYLSSRVPGPLPRPANPAKVDRQSGGAG
jgi:uncharacterized membrane protein YbhN (UPF0104 family)